MRSHYCGDINKSHVGQTITLCGWADRRRDHGGVIFVYLRDRGGIVQIVFDPDAGESFQLADSVRGEYVLKVTGKVRGRSTSTINPNMATGEIEIYASTLEVLNSAETPPFQLDSHSQVGEEVRLRYRYLDLRRPEMAHNLQFRSKVSTIVRR